MKLAEMNRRLSKERNEAWSKSLINEQIAEAATQSEQDIINTMQESLHKLHKDVYNRDVAYATLEREMKEILETSQTKRQNGLTFGSISKLNQDCLSQHEKFENFVSEISALQQQIANLEADRRDLLRINADLTFKVHRLQMNNGNKDEKQPKYEKTNEEKSSDLLVAHQNFVVSMLGSTSQNNNSLSSSSSSSNSESENENRSRLGSRSKKGGLVHLPKKKNSSFLDASSFDKKHSAKHSESKTSNHSNPVPKLDLKKAKEYTMVHVKKADANAEETNKKGAPSHADLIRMKTFLVQ